MLQASASALAAAQETRPAATLVTNNAVEAGEGPEAGLPQHPEIVAKPLCWNVLRHGRHASMNSTHLQYIGSLSASCTALPLLQGYCSTLARALKAQTLLPWPSSPS